MNILPGRGRKWKGTKVDDEYSCVIQFTYRSKKQLLGERRKMLRDLERLQKQPPAPPTPEEEELGRQFSDTFFQNKPIL